MTPLIKSWKLVQQRGLIDPRCWSGVHSSPHGRPWHELSLCLSGLDATTTLCDRFVLALVPLLALG